MGKMTQEERRRLQLSIAFARTTLDNGLIIDEEVKSILYQMIHHYTEELEKDVEISE